MADILFPERVNTIQTAIPTTGSTVNIADAPYVPNIFLLLKPAGLLAALTVNMPANPAKNQRITIMSSQIISTLTFTGGTLIGALASLAANGSISFIYDPSDSKYYSIV